MLYLGAHAIVIPGVYEYTYHIRPHPEIDSRNFWKNRYDVWIAEYST